jgi:hypothetical protein
MNMKQNTIPEDHKNQKLILELVVLFIFAVAVYIFSGTFDMLEKIVEFSWENEHLEIDELLTVAFFLSFALLAFWVRRWKDLKRALSEIKQLRGIIPICSSCKKIRDDKGYWHQVEAYISEHSDAMFSHGICPECMKKLYPELVNQ